MSLVKEVAPLIVAFIRKARFWVFKTFKKTFKVYAVA